MLEQGLQADAEEHDATEHPEAGAEATSEAAASEGAERGEQGVGDRDAADRDREAGAEHGQGEAGSERVEAGGERERREHRPGEGGGLRARRRALGGFSRVGDHLDAERAEQHEGDPVIPSRDEGDEARAGEPAERGHQGVGAAEDERSAKHVAAEQAGGRDALRGGDGGAVHREAHREADELGQCHEGRAP